MLLFMSVLCTLFNFLKFQNRLNNIKPDSTTQVCNEQSRLKNNYFKVLISISNSINISLTFVKLIRFFILYSKLFAFHIF